MISGVLRMFSGMISKVFEQDNLFLDKRIDLFFCLLWNVFSMFWLIYFCFSQKRNQGAKVPFVFCNYFSVYFSMRLELIHNDFNFAARNVFCNDFKNVWKVIRRMFTDFIFVKMFPVK